MFETFYMELGTTPPRSVCPVVSLFNSFYGHVTLSKEDIYEVLELDKMSQYRHWSIMSCSAVTGNGLVEGIDWMVEDVAKRIFMLS